MKIVAVRTHLLEYRLGVAFESASMRFDRRAHVLVEIECDDGTVGWGECLGPARPNAAVVAAYEPWLIGADPLETEKIWARLYNALRDQGQRGLTLTALSGQITESVLGQPLDGDNNYSTPGGDYTLGGSVLFRLFGDGNGDRRVDVADLGLFAGTYLKTGADPGYLAYFDVNADGRVDVTDLGQFAARYLTVLP